MAGNYMDAPGPRLAWDKDGSVLVGIRSSGGVMPMPVAANIALNSENQDHTYTTAFPFAPVWLAILFPVKTDLVATFMALNITNHTNHLQVSKDTTNGADGTWTQVVTSGIYSSNIVPDYRLASKQIGLVLGSATQELKGIRVHFDDDQHVGNLHGWFLYGYPTPSVPIDRLAFWEPTTNQELNWLTFDWGNTPRSTSEDRSFRLKNISPSRLADNITLGVEALAVGTPAITGMFTFSWDDVNYFSSLTVPDLAAGATSAVIYIRRVIPSNAEVGVRSARVSAEVGAWV